MSETSISRKYSGYLFLALSCIMYAAALMLPFFGLHAGTAAILFTVFVVIAELLFLAGAFFLGKEIVRKYRQKLNPFNWFGSKKDNTPPTEPEVKKPTP